MLDSAILQALIAAQSDRSQRSLNLKISRENKNSFGRTLSQSLAAGLGQVPGAAIGDVVEGAVRTSGSRTLANEAEARSNRLMDVPGNPLMGPVPKYLLPDVMSADRADQRDAASRTFQTGERVAGQDFTTARDASLAALKDAPVPVPGFLKEGLNLPDPMAQQEGGVLSGPLFKPMFDQANKDAGAVGGSAPESTVKSLGDLFTAKTSAENTAARTKIEEGKASESVRTNKAKEALFSDRTAAMGRLASIRASAKGQDPRLVIARLRAAESAILAAQNDLSELPKNVYLSPDDRAAEANRIHDVLNKALDEKMALDPVVEGFGAVPPPAPGTPAPGGVPAPGGAVVPPPAAAPTDEASWAKAMGEAPPEQLDALMAKYQAWKNSTPPR